MSDGKGKADKLMEPPVANNVEAIRLLRKWRSEESGYDEEVWPRVQKSMEENSLSSRKPFHE